LALTREEHDESNGIVRRFSSVIKVTQESSHGDSHRRQLSAQRSLNGTD
jgi:hypothetical protein